MKENLIEYHPNGCLKHEISYYDNGIKFNEQFYDENGLYHREGIPDFQQWYENGMPWQKIYTIHGSYQNIYGPADLGFHRNGKIGWKNYYLKNRYENKLNWMNLIKNI